MVRRASALVACFETITLPTTLDWNPPAEFDGYRVGELIARGGMGVVYAAQDLSLDRVVALKFELTRTARARETFLREGRLLAQIQHPNVLPVYRAGIVDGHAYLASELVRGRPLSELDLPLRWPRALGVGLGLARGLAATHRAGVLHRDIKLSNVMALPDGHVVLIDYGVAITELEVDSGEAALRVAGTPAYVAPEVWSGAAPSTRSDVYALGLLVRELVTGARTFTASSAASLRREVLAGVGKRIGTLRPDVPVSIAALLDRMTDVLPQNRPASAQEVRDELDSLSAYFSTMADAPLSHFRAAGAVEEPLAALIPHTRELAQEFYTLLFARAPELRALFKPDMSAQVAKLAGTLATLLRMTSTPAKLDGLLASLGRSHAAIGVTAAHYALANECLEAAIEKVAPQLFTEETLSAFRMLMSDTAAAMLAASPDLAKHGATQTATAASVAIAVPPRTRYLAREGVSLGYQILGQGPPDLVFVPGVIAHLEVMWELPELVNFFETLREMGRVIMIDPRGSGVSDRVVDDQGLDAHASDLLRILDEVHSEEAILIGLSEGAMVSTLVAARDPERVRAHIAMSARLRMAWADDHPTGRVMSTYADLFAATSAAWGEPLFLDVAAPARVADPAVRAFWSRLIRHGSSPASFCQALIARARCDVRELLGIADVPTLALHRSDDRVMPVAAARRIQELNPGTALEVHQGDDHLPFLGDARAFLASASRFLATLPPRAAVGDKLLTLGGFCARDDEADARLGALLRGAAVRGYRGRCPVDPSVHVVTFPNVRAAVLLALEAADECARIAIECGAGDVAEGGFAGPALEATRSLLREQAADPAGAGFSRLGPTARMLLGEGQTLSRFEARFERGK